MLASNGGISSNTLRRPSCTSVPLSKPCWNTSPGRSVPAGFAERYRSAARSAQRVRRDAAVRREHICNIRLSPQSVGQRAGPFLPDFAREAVLSTPMEIPVAALACALAVSCGVHAQQPLRALPIETALEARSLAAWQPPALSPDAAYVAYIACNPKKKRQIEDSAKAAGIGHEFGERWFLGCRLDIADTTTGEKLVVTSEESNSHGLAWSPDGKRLAYVAGTGA